MITETGSYAGWKGSGTVKGVVMAGIAILYTIIRYSFGAGIQRS